MNLIAVRISVIIRTCLHNNYYYYYYHHHPPPPPLLPQTHSFGFLAIPFEWQEAVLQSQILSRIQRITYGKCRNKEVTGTNGNLGRSCSDLVVLAFKRTVKKVIVLFCKLLPPPVSLPPSSFFFFFFFVIVFFFMFIISAVAMLITNWQPQSFSAVLQLHHRCAHTRCMTWWHWHWSHLFLLSTLLLFCS